MRKYIVDNYPKTILSLRGAGPSVGPENPGRDAQRIIRGQTTHLFIDAADLISHLVRLHENGVGGAAPVTLDLVAARIAAHLSQLADPLLRPNLQLIVVGATNPILVPEAAAPSSAPSAPISTNPVKPYAHDPAAASLYPGAATQICGQSMYRHAPNALDGCLDPSMRPAIYSFVLARVIDLLAADPLLRRGLSVHVMYPLIAALSPRAGDAAAEPLRQNFLHRKADGTIVRRVCMDGLHVGESVQQAMYLFRAAFRRSAVVKAPMGLEIHADERIDDLLAMLVFRFDHYRHLRGKVYFDIGGVTVVSLDEQELFSANGLFWTLYNAGEHFNLVTLALLLKTCTLPPELRRDMLGDMSNALYLSAGTLSVDVARIETAMDNLYSPNGDAAGDATQYWNDLMDFTRGGGGGGVPTLTVEDHLPMDLLLDLLEDPRYGEETTVQNALGCRSLFILPRVDFRSRFVYDQQMIDRATLVVARAAREDAAKELRRKIGARTPYPGDVNPLVMRRRAALFAWTAAYWLYGDDMCFSGARTYTGRWRTETPGGGGGLAVSYELENECQLVSLLSDAGYTVDFRDQHVASVRMNPLSGVGPAIKYTAIEIKLPTQTKEAIAARAALPTPSLRISELMHSTPLFVGVNLRVGGPATRFHGLINADITAAVADPMHPPLVSRAKEVIEFIRGAFDRLVLVAADKVAFLHLIYPNWMEHFALVVASYVEGTPPVFPNEYVCLLQTAATLQMRRDGVTIDMDTGAISTRNPSASRVYQAPIGVIYSNQNDILTRGGKTRCLLSFPLGHPIAPPQPAALPPVVPSTPAMFIHTERTRGRELFVTHHTNALDVSSIRAGVERGAGGGGGGGIWSHAAGRYDAVTVMDVLDAKPDRTQEICHVMQIGATHYYRAATFKPRVPGRVALSLLLDGGAGKLGSMAEYVRLQMTNSAVAAAIDRPAAAQCIRDTASCVAEICDYARPILARRYPKIGVGIEAAVLKSYLEFSWLGMMGWQMRLSVEMQMSDWNAPLGVREVVATRDYEPHEGWQGCAPTGLWPFSILQTARYECRTREDVLAELKTTHSALLMLCWVLPVLHDMEVYVSKDRNQIKVFFNDWKEKIAESYVRYARSRVAGLMFDLGGERRVPIRFYNVLPKIR